MSSPDEIAAALTKLYKLFIKMGYLTDADISWPPHTQHPLDISRLQELQFDQSAIDLLQKIPWALTGSNLDTGFSLIVNYSDSEELDSTRDPTNYMVDDPEKPQHLDGFVFPLNFINPRSGICLLVDVRDGTIRKLDQYGHAPEGDRDPNPLDYHHYQSAPAADVINGLYEQYSSLKKIPIWYTGEILWDGGSSLYPYAKKAMIDDYGWPDQFRTNDWRADEQELERDWWEQIG